MQIEFKFISRFPLNDLTSSQSKMWKFSRFDFMQSTGPPVTQNKEPYVDLGYYKDPSSICLPKEDGCLHLRPYDPTTSCSECFVYRLHLAFGFHALVRVHPNLKSLICPITPKDKLKSVLDGYRKQQKKSPKLIIQNQ